MQAKLNLRSCTGQAQKVHFCLHWKLFRLKLKPWGSAEAFYSNYQNCLFALKFLKLQTVSKQCPCQYAMATISTQFSAPISKILLMNSETKRMSFPERVKNSILGHWVSLCVLCFRSIYDRDVKIKQVIHSFADPLMTAFYYSILVSSFFARSFCLKPAISRV